MLAPLAHRPSACAAIALVAERLAGVKHKVLVLSGKGGVGKSTFSAQLAFTLAAKGRTVGLLDIDICGPSIPRMLGLVDQKVHQSASGWSPVWIDDNLGVMSIGFMLPSEWFGRAAGRARSDVGGGALDMLVVALVVMIMWQWRGGGLLLLLLLLLLFLQAPTTRSSGAAPARTASSSSS